MSIAIALLLCAPALATQKIGDLVFQTDFDSLMQTAHEQKQPVLIKFYTDW